jgi:hypothetical protein
MLDVLRAYGLAYTISASSQEAEVMIQDYGHTYIISVKGDLPQTVSPQLFVDSDGWSRVFQTMRERKDATKLHPKKDVEKILKKELTKLLTTHEDPSFQPTLGNTIEDGRPLYQSIDVSAAKGFREEKRGQTYHEGSQLYVDKYSWAIACIGGAFFSSSYWGGDFILNLIPNPFKVWMLQHRQIRDDLKKEHICNASVNVALVHYSVKLARILMSRKEARNIKYSSVIFNTMRKTGQQPKPSGGGKYSLALLERFIQLGWDGGLALEKIDKIMASGFVKGVKQELAFAFAELILHPSLRNLVRCEDLYIRAYINEGMSLWDKGTMEVVLRNVEDR